MKKSRNSQPQNKSTREKIPVISNLEELRNRVGKMNLVPKIKIFKNF